MNPAFGFGDYEINPDLITAIHLAKLISYYMAVVQLIDNVALVLTSAENVNDDFSTCDTKVEQLNTCLLDLVSMTFSTAGSEAVSHVLSVLGGWEFCIENLRKFQAQGN